MVQNAKKWPKPLFLLAKQPNHILYTQPATLQPTSKHATPQDINNNIPKPLTPHPHNSSLETKFEKCWQK